MLTRWQIQELEKLYRMAVKLQANPAGGDAPCEMGCGRLGRDAHHMILRSQEMGIRWMYEPRWGLYLCSTCHGISHANSAEFRGRAIEQMSLRDAQRAWSIKRIGEMHPRLRCPKVSFPWMRAYLRRRIVHLQAAWSSAYCCDL